MLHWEGWTYNIITAWIEIILHGIGCLLITLVLLEFIWVFICDSNIMSCFNHLKSNDNSNDTGKDNISLSPKSQNRNFSISFSKKIAEPRSPEYYLKLILFGSIFCGVISVYSNFWVSNILILVYNIKPPHGCFHRALCLIPLYLQRLLTFSFFLYRLKLTFNGSIFALSSLAWYSLIIGLFVILSGSLSFIIIASYISGLFRCSDPIVFIAFGVAGILDIGYSILVCYIFVSKLNNLVKMMKNEVDNSRIKNVMKKLTILTLVSVISSMFMSVAVAVQVFGYQFQALDIVINNICMMLSFGKLDNQFNKFCGCFIKLQQYCCSRIESTQTRNSHNKINSDIIDSSNASQIP